MQELVCGGRQFQLLVHVPVRQAHGAVQVPQIRFGSEQRRHASLCLGEAVQETSESSAGRRQLRLCRAD